MTDYVGDIVRRLREQEHLRERQICREAADVIEDLTMRLHKFGRVCEALQAENFSLSNQADSLLDRAERAEFMLAYKTKSNGGK